MPDAHHIEAMQPFVRTQNKPALPPPGRTTGVIAWMQTNLFSSVSNTLLTLLGAYLLYLIVPSVLDWALFSATFTGDGRDACLRDGAGACWPFIDAKMDQFIYGRYPLEERWRVDWTFFLGVAGLIPMLIPSVPYKLWNAIYLLVPYPVIAFLLLTGGTFGLVEVETSFWGGMLVTLVVAITGIVASLPLGILLALGRRSEMPVIRMLCIGFIEIWRGVPLITVLFMASVMLPLFLPEGVTFDKLLRCLVAVALFSSAYMAEVVRGGLQAVPRGQYEGAQALGLNYWKMMVFVILPQALKTVIPGIVNSFIALFKDTTLVLIIGLFDFLGIIQLNFTDPEWSTPQTAITGYVFAASIYFVICSGMSQYSRYMERRLDTGHRND
ncbi:General L-amino acid transport system permease protein [Candidatus Phaeomarinobacter ectocarpi]|uniref:General L-amino acid transport system permease protein n=1 Tax=Candidatus Phaeomarinibacter ectocarpi TaxID=1458461 RepID=X5MB48_9HYPH|nr:General L-amino acid transport system permease protein [Candidatus Phaeomarinobacter ectocarpi]